MSNNSIQPEWRSNYRGDYREQSVKPICTQDLLCWAFQIARGMEYLASRKVNINYFMKHKLHDYIFIILLLGSTWRFGSKKYTISRR